MLRPFVYSVLAFVILTHSLAASNAFAQQSVGVRTGEHDDYSRLVFDWENRPAYSADESQDGRLVINFEQAAQISAPPASTNTATYISSFEVLSSDPLSVALRYAAGAKVRAFQVGDRLVVDVYKTENTAQQANASRSLTPPPEPVAASETETETEKDTAQNQSTVQDDTPPEPSPVSTITPTSTSPTAPPTAPLNPLATSDAPSPNQSSLNAVSLDDKAKAQSSPAPEIPILQQLSKTQKPSVISMSSTRTQGLASFVLNDQLWLVNDQPDGLFSPQFSGPDSKRLSPLQSTDLEGGRAFRTQALKDKFFIRGQGGGLVWRVILSHKPKTTSPVRPIREGVEDGAIRSGTVIWPLSGASKIIDVPDPLSGRNIKVITVEAAKQFSGPAYDFVDFTTLPSPVGLAIIPKVDDLNVEITERGVEVSRQDGLAVQSESQIISALALKNKAQKKTDDDLIRQTKAQPSDSRRVFDFNNWQLGGIDALSTNANIILDGMHQKSNEARIEALVTLGKMYLSFAQGAEALGFLNFAGQVFPALLSNPEFLALRGASKALNWKSEDAFNDLSIKSLEPFEEIGLWRAYVLADLGDWNQAAEVLPKDHSIIYSYPDLVFNRLAVVIAEIELRSGLIKEAEDLLAEVEKHDDTLFEPQRAALAYLQGEAARQKKDTDKTKKLWEPLTTGPDDLYRAKAGLALTRLLVNEGKLTPKKAIDRLERLRYAWRGDQLEAQIYYWLGRTYFEASEYVKGLNIMREAAAVASGTQLGARVAAEMSDIFTNLFLSDELQKVSPLDATALYEQFSELVPSGSKGDKVVENLAEHMVKADLLGRASGLLSHQLDHRLSGSEAHRVGVRLAAIHLLNNKPDEARKALGKASEALQALPEGQQTPEKFLEISLLRARTLSDQKRPDQALAMLNDLEPVPNVNRLRADIAWHAGYWDDAAEALEDVILDENISLTRPLNADHTNLFLNRAVALNLDGDRVGLANMRERYSDAMAQTDKARAFEVITRPRQSAALADRDTLLGIVSEVDLFEDFMNSYRENSSGN